MTNLIEQLGGYEACSNAYKELISKDKDIITCGSTIITKDQMRDMLLEHRRQHNILEIGDKVFLAETENEIQIVTERTKELFYNLGFVHCTDKEIAQGYRDE